MRVLQLIDSLRPGGAERMAVNYANAFSKYGEGSYLCCTRQEGSLRSQLFPEVGYLSLEKNSSLDVRAFRKLRQFIVSNQIDLIHAHGTSWFMAALVKITLPRVKLVWHDHYGKDLNSRPVLLLKLFSILFDGVISVNAPLKKWAEHNLRVKRVVFLKNFLAPESAEDGIRLKGNNDFKIICLANFRPQKDHLSLFKAYKRLLDLSRKKLSLHLVGKDLKDDYSGQIHNYVKTNDLKDVHIYGEQQAIGAILKQGDLGVLSSSSEGLPLALLEYGRAGLPVVCTRVGQCPDVVGNTGSLVDPGQEKDLAEAILAYITDHEFRTLKAKEFQQKVNMEYSEEKVFPKALGFYKSLI